MDAEHEAAFEKLTRRLPDYDELLRWGHVEARVDDVEAWRRDIRAKARADKLRIATFGDAETGSVTAMLRRGVAEGQMRQSLALVEVQREAEDRASLHGHEIRVWWRHDGDAGEAATVCPRCGARVYVRGGPPRLIVGDVFEVECRAS